MKPKEFSADMPKILFVIDNDFEQRYYRSPVTAARGLYGWLSRKHGRFVAYRRIDETSVDEDGIQNSPNLDRFIQIMDEELAKFTALYPQGLQPNTPMKQWNKDESDMNKRILARLISILEQIA